MTTDPSGPEVSPPTSAIDAWRSVAGTVGSRIATGTSSWRSSSVGVLAAGRTGRRGLLGTHAAGGAVWTILRLLTQAFEFLAWVVIARRFPVADVGVLASGSLVARYLGLLSDWGAHHVGAGLVAAGRSAEQWRLVKTRTSVAMIASLLFGTGTAVLGLLHLMPFVAVVAARGANLDWIGHGRGRYISSTVPALIGSMIMVIGALVAPSVSAVAVGFAWSGCVWLALSVAVNRQDTLTLARAAIGEAVSWSRAGWVMVLTMADQLMATADVLIVGWLMSTSAAGVYATVYRFPNAILMVVGLASAASVPVVVRLANSGASVDSLRTLTRLGAATGLLVLVAAVPLTIAAPGVLGDGYRVGQPALLLLFVAASIIAFTAPFRVVLLSDRPGRRLSSVFVAAAGANLLLNGGLVPLAGMAGAASATVLTQIGLAVVVVMMVARPAWRHRPTGSIGVLERCGRPGVGDGTGQEQELPDAERTDSVGGRPDDS